MEGDQSVFKLGSGVRKLGLGVFFADERHRGCSFLLVVIEGKQDCWSTGLFSL